MATFKEISTNIIRILAGIAFIALAMILISSPREDKETTTSQLNIVDANLRVNEITKETNSKTCQVKIGYNIGDKYTSSTHNNLVIANCDCSKFNVGDRIELLISKNKTE